MGSFTLDGDYADEVLALLEILNPAGVELLL